MLALHRKIFDSPIQHSTRDMEIMMTIPVELKPYAKQLGYPNSKTLGILLTKLFDTDEKLKLAAALPGKASELAEKLGYSIEKTEQLLKELHLNGAINSKMHQPGAYRLFPGMIELRDASVVTPDISSEMINLWDDLVRNELPGFIPELIKMGIPPMMRVIPIEEAVE